MIICFSRMVLIKYPENGSLNFDVNFTEVEHTIHYPDASSLTNKVYGSLTILAIILVNSPLLIYIFKNGNTTFINKLIAIDCFLCIGNIVPVCSYYIFGRYRGHVVCLIFPTYSFLSNLTKRLLSIGIVLYRYVFVVQNSWVRTQFQRQMFFFLVAGTIATLSTVTTTLMFLNRENFFHFLGINI